jgi:hypothetical protein
MPLQMWPWLSDKIIHERSWVQPGATLFSLIIFRILPDGQASNIGAHNHGATALAQGLQCSRTGRGNEESDKAYTRGATFRRVLGCTGRDLLNRMRRTVAPAIKNCFKYRGFH